VQQLILGDCIEEMAKLDAGSVDLVLTDPPYGMNFQSNWSKAGPRHGRILGDDIVDDQWLGECHRLLSPDNGGLVMFCNWDTSCTWRRLLEHHGFKVKSQVIWNRLHHGMGDLRGGFAPMHDVIWYAVKKNARRIFKNGRPKSVIEDRRPSPSEDHGHPTCKPVSLMEKLYRAVETENSRDLITLDPFMGSGSTGVAVKNLNRAFIGIEKDPKYYAIACGRMNTLPGLK